LGIEQAHLSPPTVLALFSIHSHCFCSFSIYFLHFAFMFLLLVFMSFHFNCMSFHFDDPRSGMYNPVSVKRILNAKGTAFTALLFTRERLYFIPPVPSSTSACITCKYQSKREQDPNREVFTSGFHQRKPQSPDPLASQIH